MKANSMETRQDYILIVHEAMIERDFSDSREDIALAVAEVSEMILGKTFEDTEDEYVDMLCTAKQRIKEYFEDDALMKDIAKYYLGEEVRPILDENLCFKYLGFDFELSDCVGTDRYVCWMYDTVDAEGLNLKKYLEKHPIETVDCNCWCPLIHLVPEAWSWGSSFDLKEGNIVNDVILTGCQNFIKTLKKEI